MAKFKKNVETPALENAGSSTQNSYIDIAEISAPSNPSANTARLYSADDTGTTKLYFRDSSGTVTEIGAGGTGSSSDIANISNKINNINLSGVSGHSTGQQEFNTVYNPYVDSELIDTGSVDEAFYGGCFDGEYIWICPNTSADIVKIHKETKAITTIAHGQGAVNFRDAVFDGKYIWLAPYTGANVLKIDISDNSITTVAHSQSGTYYYTGICFDGTHVWLAPYDTGVDVLKIDVSDDSISTIAQSENQYAFSGCVFANDHVWMVPEESDNILKIDISDDSVTQIAHGQGSNAFRGAVYDGKYVWMGAYVSDNFIKIDVETNEITTIAHSDTSGRPSAGLVYDGISIWSVPYTSNNLYKINPVDNSVTAFTQSFSEAFRGGVFDGNYIWYFPWDNNGTVRFRPYEFGQLSSVADAGAVMNTGNESIDGIKTFTSFPIMPTADPTSDYEVATKKYVDDNSGGSSTGLESLSEGTTTGWAFVGDDRDNKGDIGINAVDMSTSITASSTRGATGDYSVAMGYATTSGDYSISGGYNNTASGSCSFAIGYVNTASGNYSISTGNTCTSSDIYTISFGNHSQATADHAIAGGHYCEATHDYGVALGYYSKAYNYRSFVFGDNCTARGKESLAFGFRCETNKNRSVAIGYYALARYEGFVASSSGPDNLGETQTETGVITAKTTNDTPTFLYPYSTFNKITIPSNATFGFVCHITAKLINTSGTGMAFYKIEGMATNDSSSTVINYKNVTTLFEGDGTGGAEGDTDMTGCSVDAVISTDDLEIQVTGISATSIKWVAKLELIENVY